MQTTEINVNALMLLISDISACHVPYIDNDYSGVTVPTGQTFDSYTDDPLWDGQGCGPTVAHAAHSTILPQSN